MNGYAAAVRQFYDIYRPIARRYGLRMSSHTSIYDDGWIKIYKGKGSSDQLGEQQEGKKCKTIGKHIKSHCRNLGSYQKSQSKKKKSENNMLFLAAVACVATAQTMWKRQTHAQEK